MNLSLIRSMTRSAVFELENGKCFRPEHPFAVALNGKTIYENEILQDYFLNQCDFQDCIYNVDSDCYEFEGENYDYKEEIMRILLDRKINNNKQKIA